MDSWEFFKQKFSVEGVLRRRGHVVAGTGDETRILTPPHPFDGHSDLYAQMKKESFRKVARRLLRHPREPVALDALKQMAGDKASEYVEFLEKSNAVQMMADGTVVFCREEVDNLGPTLAWFVAEVLKRELWADTLWDVCLKDSPEGDFDVIAWLDPVLMYVETKTARLENIERAELGHFLHRAQWLAPDVAVLLVDTQDSLDDLVLRLNEVFSLARARADGNLAADIVCDQCGNGPTRGINQQTPLCSRCEAKLNPTIQLQTEFGGIYFGFARIYVTGSHPSVETQLRRCLHHHYSRVRGRAVLAGDPYDFLAAIKD